MTKQESQVRPKPGDGDRRVHLDRATVRALKAPTKSEALSWLYLDDEVPGFCCQVTYGCAKTFRMRYRQAGKWYSVRIGAFQDDTRAKAMPSADATNKKRPGISAGDARIEAVRLRAEIDKGANPALEDRVRQAEVTKAAEAALTVEQAYRRYLASIRSRRSPMRESSIQKVEGTFDLHVLPLLGERAVGSLTQSDVRGLAEAVSRVRKRKGRQIGGPIAANRVIAHLSAFLTWCSKQEPPLVEANVARLIARGEVLEKEHARERYLSNEEWTALMRDLDDRPYWATRGSRYTETVAVRLEKPNLRTLVSCEAIRVSLLTGARKGEVYRMRWADIDLEARWWRKPRETTKGGRVHEVALPMAAVQSLQALRAAHADPVWVFPGKQRLDKLARGEKPRANEGTHIQSAHEMWGKIRTELGMPDVRQHDLRHTTASVLISNGADLFTVGAQLGHLRAQTTMRYAHLQTEAKHRLASIMDAFAQTVTSSGEGKSR